jgi:hypothetical protein
MLETWKKKHKMSDLSRMAARMRSEAHNRHLNEARDDEAIESAESVPEQISHEVAEADPLQLAFGILVSGSTESQANDILNFGNIEIPPHNQLNEALKTIGEAIVEMAKRSCDEAVSNLPAGTVISFDGSWEHRRNSQRCFVAVCCQQTSKVIGYIVMTNRGSVDAENFCAVAQNMEVAGMRILLDQLRAHPEIAGYVHDKDAKTTKLFRESKWEVKEYLDPGHAMKSLERSIEKFSKDIYQIPDWVHQSLKKFMKTLLFYVEMDVDQKKAAWINSCCHFRGDHKECPYHHKETPVWDVLFDQKFLSRFTEFLEKTQWILEKCHSEFSTQLNESLNRSKLKYASKDVKWGSSFDARMGCAVLDRNCPYWKLELYSRLHLPALSDMVKWQLICREEERLKNKTTVALLSEKERRRSLRRIEMAKRKREPRGKVDYKVRNG